MPPSADDPAPRRVTRRAFLGALGLAAAVTGAPKLRARAAEPAANADQRPVGASGRREPPEIIGQATIGDMACGPCALANALTHGDAACRRAFAALDGDTAPARVQTLIKRYGDRPSETYRGSRPRYSKTDGTNSEDLPYFANDFFAAANLPAVEGQWLNMHDGENGRHHLRRLHGMFADALAAGLPAMVEVRSFGANTTAEKGPEWNGLMGHWMPVVGVEPAALPERATGFVCRFVDSVSGEEIEGYAHAELHRPFTATRGFVLNEDGSRKWDWITGYPYILLQAPDLGLKTQMRLWHERTYFSLMYAVCR